VERCNILNVLYFLHFIEEKRSKKGISNINLYYFIFVLFLERKRERERERISAMQKLVRRRK